MIRSMLQKGQIAIGIIPIAIGGIMFVATPIIAFYSSQAAAEEKLAEVSERTARLETVVPTIKEDTDEIKDDIKDIKRALNVK